jgi:hypothetical protein
LGRASELPIGGEDSPTRRRLGLSDVLWVAAIFVWWLVLLLWFPFLTNATLTRFSAGAFRLAVWEGAAMGVAVFLAVRFGGAPRLVWIGVAIPATLAIVVLALLRVLPNSPAGAIGWGYYLYAVVLPSVVSAVCAYLFSTLPRRTPEWSRDD